MLAARSVHTNEAAKEALKQRLTASNNPWLGKVDINLHHVFGHALGAGVQAWLQTGDRNFAVMAILLSWNAPLTEEIAKDGKSVWFVIVALDKFIVLMKQPQLAGYRLATINGRPAIEVEFSIDTESGYVYFGHIDAVLISPAGEYTVLELKSSSSNLEHEAKYQNSEQAPGYGLVLNTLFNAKNFTVIYALYSTTDREWTLLPFKKSAVQRAEWITTLVLDCQLIDTYREANHFPKRGQQCFKYSRICQHFSLCGLDNERFGFASLEAIPKDNINRLTAHHFKLSDIIAANLGEQHANTPAA